MNIYGWSKDTENSNEEKDNSQELSLWSSSGALQERLHIYPAGVVNILRPGRWSIYECVHVVKLWSSEYFRNSEWGILETYQGCGEWKERCIFCSVFMNRPYFCNLGPVCFIDQLTVVHIHICDPSGDPFRVGLLSNVPKWGLKNLMHKGSAFFVKTAK